jgi:hypothetical protein
MNSFKRILALPRGVMNGKQGAWPEVYRHFRSTQQNLAARRATTQKYKRHSGYFWVK